MYMKNVTYKILGAGTEIHHQLTAIYKNVYEECNVQNPHGLLHRGYPRACYRL